jgi:hypothetical protein
MWTVVRCGGDCSLDENALNFICARARGALDVLDITCTRCECRPFTRLCRCARVMHGHFVVDERHLFYLE